MLHFALFQPERGGDFGKKVLGVSELAGRRQPQKHGRLFVLALIRHIFAAVLRLRVLFGVERKCDAELFPLE